MCGSGDIFCNKMSTVHLQQIIVRQKQKLRANTNLFVNVRTLATGAGEECS